MMYMKQKRLVSFILCLALVLSGFGSMVVSAADDPSVLDLTDESVNSEKQFSALQMKVYMLRDGNINIKYDMALSNTYLSQKRSDVEKKVENGELQMEDFPIRESGMSDEEYREAVYEYMDRLYQRLDDSVLPKIQVTLTYDKAIFELPDKDSHISLESVNDYGETETIGYGDLSLDANGNIVLTCNFNKIVYNRTNVYVSFSLDFLLRPEVDSGEALRPVWMPAKRIISGQVQPISSGSILSEGSLWIIVGVAVVALGAAAYVIVRKKKTGVVNSEK